MIEGEKANDFFMRDDVHVVGYNWTSKYVKLQFKGKIYYFNLDKKLILNKDELLAVKL